MEQRKKSSTQKWVFFWLWWDMLVSMRIRVLPKGWFPKATWQKPRGCFQATNLFFRPPSRIRNWLNWGARKKMMVVRGCRWLCVFFCFFFSEKTSAKLKGWNVMIESYNAWIVFKCCESIKETKLTVDIWTAENPPAWNDFCFRKASPARTAFDLQSDEGYVSKGQLLWMLADSGMPVNKAGWRLLRCKKKVWWWAFASQMAPTPTPICFRGGFVGTSHWPKFE